MNEKKQINECIEYFRNSSIWKRIFKGFKEKYSSYGRFSGKVIVRNPEDNDIEELEGSSPNLQRGCEPPEIR